MGISLSNKSGHMTKSVCRISCTCKIWCFPGCLFYYYDTTFSAKTVYLRESGKIGSINELKISVKRCQFLHEQREKIDLSRKDLEYWNEQNDTQKSNKGGKDKKKRQIY